MSKGKSILMVSILLLSAVGCLLWGGRSAVTLQVVAYETNSLPEISHMPFVTALVRMSNGTSRPLFYHGDSMLRPFYTVDILTEKGWAKANRGGCALGADDWAISAQRSTDFSVRLSDSKRPLHVSVEYIQTGTLQKVWQGLPASITRWTVWSPTKRTVSTVIQQPGMEVSR